MMSLIGEKKDILNLSLLALIRIFFVTFAIFG